MFDPLTKTALGEHAVRQVQRALDCIPITEEDVKAVDRMERAAAAGERFYFELAKLAGVAVTPGLWAIFLLGLTGEWTTRAQDVAVTLPTLRGMYPESGDAELKEVLDAAAAVLEGLGWLAWSAETDDEDDVDEDADSNSLLSRFERLARAVERLGDADTAYNLVALALDLGPEEGGPRERVARYGLELALTADRMHQAAFCSSTLAAAVASAADANASRRLEAFDCCEAAIEWISLAPPQFAQIAARMLAQVVASRIWLRPLMVPLLSWIPEADRPPGYADAIGAESWPERVSKRSRAEWAKELRALLTAQMWEIELENTRLTLEPAQRADAAHADWLVWNIDHPAYRRALPHYRSFLREADFDGILLVLTHEITHSLSLIGGLGIALTCLRTAALNAELALWSNVAGAEGGDLEERIATVGVAPIRPGNAAALFRAEQGVELALKAQILQDVWRPWFEGLAVYGEVAADPALHPDRITAVGECVRNLVDFIPDANASTQADAAEVQARYQALVAEIETKSSEAVRRRGPQRLRKYLSAQAEPYLAGYLAVCGIVSAWREAADQPLSATEAFELLLHATRFGVRDFIPDLSIRSELFGKAALEGMCAWACSLLQLTRGEIDGFLAPSVDGAPRPYAWMSGHLVAFDGDSADAEREQKAHLTTTLEQALRSLGWPEDVGRGGVDDPIAIWLMKLITDDLGERARQDGARLIDLVIGLVNAGSLLPIGRTAARFLLNADPTSPAGTLATLIRTTENHVEGGQASINNFWFPISRAGADVIGAAYRRLGNPRIEMTRVIDLAGVANPDRASAGHHLFAWRYGDWFDIRGANPWVEQWLAEDPSLRDALRDRIRTRLYPSGLALTEQRIIARGLRGAERTRDWIEASTEWTVKDVSAPGVAAWGAHVRALACRVLAPDERVARQRDAARSMVFALFNDADLANGVVDRGFDAMSRGLPERRSDLVQALFETARRPTREASIIETIDAYAGAGLALFHHGRHGLDVRPASLEVK